MRFFSFHQTNSTENPFFTINKIITHFYTTAIDSSAKGIFRREHDTLPTDSHSLPETCVPFQQNTKRKRVRCLCVFYILFFYVNAKDSRQNEKEENRQQQRSSLCSSTAASHLM